jgi:nucleotide-binding universal stress UspA family protein
MASQIGARLTLLNVVAGAEALAGHADRLRDLGRLYGAQSRFLFSNDVAGALSAELTAHADAIAALTTHGRTAWGEAIIGSVAFGVIRGARRPVLLFRPIAEESNPPTRISSIAVALDGSEFAERILPVAVELAKTLSARLMLLQALPSQTPVGTVPLEIRNDVNDPAYLQRIAARLKEQSAVTCDWEVLHGAPADAICAYVNDLRETLLAFTTHARGGLERAMLGSVAAACIRHAIVPLLVHWPKE